MAFGLTGSIALAGPVTFNYTAGIAIDPSGNAAPYAEWSQLTVSTSPAAFIGVSVLLSNATTLQDISGSFDYYSSGGGYGPYASGNGFVGIGTQGQAVLGGGFTFGVGAGLSSSGGMTNTWVGSPIFSVQPIGAPNPILGVQ